MAVRFLSERRGYRVGDVASLSPQVERELVQSLEAEYDGDAPAVVHIAEPATDAPVIADAPATADDQTSGAAQSEPATADAPATTGDQASGTAPSEPATAAHEE